MTELTAVARAMTDPIWLTPDELHQLTGRKRWSAQARALASAQIPFRLNAQGRRCPRRKRTEPSEGPARSTLMAPRQRPA